MTDLLNRAAGQVDQFATHLGGNTTVGVVPRTAMIDYSRVEKLLLGGAWIAIKPGSLAYQTYGHPGGLRLFWTWTTPEGDAAGATANEVGFSPLVERQPTTPAQTFVPQPAPIECASAGCPNLVSRSGQHCENCCGPDCRHDEPEPVVYITEAEAREALQKATEYAEAADRAGSTVDRGRFLRLASQERAKLDLPRSEADPEPDETIVLDTASPLASMLDRPKK